MGDGVNNRIWTADSRQSATRETGLESGAAIQGQGAQSTKHRAQSTAKGKGRGERRGAVGKGQFFDIVLELERPRGRFNMQANLGNTAAPHAR
jgi:hypothetical protein